MGRLISEHFRLAEFLPDGADESAAPAEVVVNVTLLATSLLEPLRVHFGVPVVIHDAWRPAAHNAAVRGEPSSDHIVGAAVDFHVAESPYEDWEANTIAAYDWLRENKDGDFGQLILEDHRRHTGDPGKLWVHVSLKTAKHGGTRSDQNRVLVSYAPRQYESWQDARLA